MSSSVSVDGAVAVESQYRSIFENAVEGIYQTTVEGQYLRVNPALARIYGYTSPDALITGLTDIAGQLYFDPERRDAFKKAMAEDGIVQDFEAQVYRRDGSVIWITENARCVRDGRGDIAYYEGTVEDITRRKSDEEQIRLLAKVFESVGDGILIVDSELKILAVNPAYESIAGFAASDIIGTRLDVLAPGYHESSFLKSVTQDVRRRGHWSGEVTWRRAKGTPFVADVTISAVRGGEGAQNRVIITCADISLRKRQEQRIQHQANFDLLTQLPNRWLTTERLERAILVAARNRSGLAVMFCDLNGFKQVNDGMGHQAGDELLRLVAKRLRSATRLSDIVGRLGGDEFLIVGPITNGRPDAMMLAHKVLYSFTDPFVINGREVFCLPSIGIAHFPEDGHNAEMLLRNADMAMYTAKQNKAQPVVHFEPHMLSAAADRLALENDLRRACERGEFVLHFQPKVDSHTHRIIGAEALVRWDKPGVGLVPPAAFIPIAEESGIITTIGEWTLREACKQFMRWRAEGLRLESVSVNLSPTQFLDRNLAKVVARILEETGIDPGALELELTESAMSVDMEHAITILGKLKALGVKLAIDDFGTGYSSLAYLKRLPIDVVKIDQSFVRGLGESFADENIVGAIVGLASRLGFALVAEGVENVLQANLLRDVRCETLQGYLFSRPVAAGVFAQMLERAAAA